MCEGRQNAKQEFPRSKVSTNFASNWHVSPRHQQKQLCIQSQEQSGFFLRRFRFFISRQCFLESLRQRGTFFGSRLLSNCLHRHSWLQSCLIKGQTSALKLIHLFYCEVNDVTSANQNSTLFPVGSISIVNCVMNLSAPLL